MLITLTFRSEDDGPLAGVNSAATSVLRPFAVGAERIAQPFRDAYSWTDSLLTARSDAEKLRAEVRELRQELIQSQVALLQNKELRSLLKFVDGPRFPEDFAFVAGRGHRPAALDVPAGDRDRGRRGARRARRRPGRDR